jgi:antitoxin component YwqK of YwqJK toxin-antitoxin module
MKRIFFLLVVSLLSSSVFSINEVDSKGRKQGVWKKPYGNGYFMYEGEFKDGQPVGTFKRYYENGVLKSIQQYGENETSAIVIYENDGLTKAAQGAYIGKEKEGEWIYYVDGKVSLIEHYAKGVLVDTVKSFAKTGELIEKTPYKNGKMDGLQSRYLEDGKLYSESPFKMGVEDGVYKLYEGHDFPVIEGLYVGGKKHGNWLLKDDAGNVKDTMKYDMGVLLNRRELIKEQAKEADEYEKNEGKIPEPDQMSKEELSK